MPATAIVPAYNEAKRIIPVVEAIRACPLIDEILVVDDGSQDRTGDIAAHQQGVRVIRLNPNEGKAGAMLAGAAQASNETIAFLDADLVGLSPAHIAALVAPLLSGQAEMAVGQFRGGRGHITLWQMLLPAISGQRAMRRDRFLALARDQGSRFGIEIALTRLYRRHRLRLVKVPLRGVTHVTKEEKVGWLRGLAGRFIMYWQMARGLLAPLK